MISPLLPTILSPHDLKGLSLHELIQLSTEIRQRIMEVMSVNGGHLASNLGSVELTLALHRVFNSPEDKFIWDVSHQTYTHKIVTGRNDRFDTIRQYKGLCGFSDPQESVHDHFHAGHAGTALSLALGVAKNRDLTKRGEYIVPIIGDATLTCGMSQEALNNISRDLKRFIIILNDNAMSISKNVGAITHILSRMLSNPTTNRIYQEIDNLISKIPGCGSLLSKQGHKITESLKNLVSPAAFFEQYGLCYIGPIDGHDVKKLIDVFEGVKESQWPVVIHVLTKKGQGMEEAVNNPVSYHGVKPFNLDTGKFHPTTSHQSTFPKIFGTHLLKMAESDPSILAVTPAMTAGSCLDAFIKKFPERCLDVGIAEAHAVTFCGGLAHGGRMKVVSSIYATFLQRALDNLFHDVCLQKLPIIFAIDRAGISGPDGSTHHGIYDIAFLNAMPNMVISQPRNGHLLKELLESSFSWKRPTAIRYPNMATEELDMPLNYRELGKGEVLIEGKELLIIALGHMCEVGFEICEGLRQEGIEATLLDPVFVKPLDAELLCHLLITHRKVITIEEHSVQAGMGAIMNHFLLKNGYNKIEVLNFGIPETFVEHGSHKELMHELGLTAKQITEQILLSERQQPTAIEQL
ncbi:MAG: 1-deoxy-D-xylulose-5-phosphate synthase [Parachlamydiaceae bacterium]|nr:1-deoxy-D-xylulose-5-phosphate synthase [Parachlamydiaceae bacterium]